MVMIRLLIEALVTPLATLNTEKLLLDPPPLTVTRLVSVVPLPLVAPVMVVLEGTLNELASVIVCGVANTVGSKVTFPAPKSAALVRASRSVPWPLSAVEVTTKSGIAEAVRAVAMGPLVVEPLTEPA